MLKNKRQPNFTADELEVLVAGVERSKKVLLGRFSGVVSAAAKSKGWDELAKEVTAVSGISRSGPEIQKKWVCMKSGAKAAVVERKRDLKVTGGGTSSGVTTSDNQQRIMEVIGKVAVDGIDGGFDSVATLPEDAASEVAAPSEDCGELVEDLLAVMQPHSQDHLKPEKKEKKGSKRSAVEQELISLQQQTLNTVAELLDVEKARLEIEREKLALKKIKLMTKGVVQDESGNWVWVKVPQEE